MQGTPKVLSTYNSENLNECNNGQSAGNQNNRVIPFMSRILRDYMFYTKPSFRFAEEIVHKGKKLPYLMS